MTLHSAAAVLLLAALVGAAHPVTAGTAGSAGSSQYRDSVQRALADIQGAAGPNTAPAANALADLAAGGTSQPEIQADLSARPPDYAGARARLSALLAALDSPATTADPAAARQRLAGILAMSRYAALHRPPSLLDRLEQWVADRLRDLARLLFGGGGTGPLPLWLLYAAAVIVIVAVLAVVFNATRGRFRSSSAAPPAGGPRLVADYFADADRLAEAGDLVGAIRNLCAGVAGSLAGARTWEGSPLTVREIFRRAPEPEGLLPLLRPFEAAVYGGRGVDPETYEKAAAVARRFRNPEREAAA